MNNYIFRICTIVLLMFIIISCDQQSPVSDYDTSENSGIIKINPSDIRHIPPPQTPCDPLVTDLISDVQDFTDPSSGTVIGTVTITNDDDYVYVQFLLNQDAIDAGYWIDEVFVWLHQQYSGRSSTVDENPEDQPTEVNLAISDSCLIFNCQYTVDIVAKAIVCTDNGTLGAGAEDVLSLMTCEDINLVANKFNDAGQVQTEIDGDNLKITYTTENGWKLKEVRLAISSNNCDNIPRYSGGAPKLNDFPYQSGNLNNLTSYSFEIPLDDLGIDCDVENPFLCIAAWAKVMKSSSIQSAWGICPTYGEKMTKYGCEEMYKVYLECDDGSLGQGEEVCYPAWGYGPRKTGQFLDEGFTWAWKLEPYSVCCE